MSDDRATTARNKYKKTAAMQPMLPVIGFSRLVKKADNRKTTFLVSEKKQAQNITDCSKMNGDTKNILAREA